MRDYIYSPEAEVSQTVHIDAVFDDYLHTSHMSAVGVTATRAIHQFLCVAGEAGNTTLTVRISEWQDFIGCDLPPIIFTDDGFGNMPLANEPFYIRLGCVSDVVLRRYNNLLIDAWSRYVVGSGHPEQYQTLRYATTCVDEEYEQRWEFPPSRDEYYGR